MLLAFYKFAFSRVPAPSDPEQALLLSYFHQQNTLSNLSNENIDWADFYQLALEHNVLPTLYWRLKNYFPGTLPPETFQSIEAYFQFNRWKSMRILTELGNLLDLFEQHHIPVMILKGATLAFTLYDDPFAREYKDIDLLLHREDVDAARQLLFERGYEESELHGIPLKITNNFYETDHIAFVRKRDNAYIEVELHWGMPISFSDEQDQKEVHQIWQKAVPAQFGDFQFNTLPPADLLFLLVMHLTKHRWKTIRWSYEIALFLNLYRDLPWREILAEAEARHTHRLLLLNLRLANSLYGAPLPPVVQEHIERDPIVDAMIPTIRHLVFDWQYKNTLIGQFQIVLSIMLLRQNWRDRLIYIFHVIRHPRSTSAKILIWGIIALVVLLIFLLVRN